MAQQIGGLGGSLAGAAIGTAIGGPLGGIIGSAVLGTVGGAIGGVIDNRLFGRDTTQNGPRLTGAGAMSSTEGAPIPRIYGSQRVGGTLIWMAHLLETVQSTTQRTGKGSRPKATTNTFSYSLSFAVSLGEGPIDGIGRVWADGIELDMLQIAHTVYLGDETQTPDPLIEGIDGAGNVPAYRGTAYIVFDGYDVTAINGRPPQISVEVFRYPASARLPIKGVAALPGSGDHSLDPVAQFTRVLSSSGAEISRDAINVSQVQDRADALVSLDQLERDIPAVETVSIVVGWFFDSLNPATANVRPKVDFGDKLTTPRSWVVSGVTRGAADEVTRISGDPAYGATPDDLGLFRLIAECKARGFRVIIYPFLFSDFVGYPWRGRIAAANPATAAADIAAFMGTAAPAQIGAWDGSTCPYSGSGFGLRRMVLHYSRLADAAWGASDRNRLMIVIGSELRDLTTSRDGSGGYPMVAALVTLAADVRSIVGAGVKITYAADWSEYFGHQPADGSGDVFFHLDPLWGDPNIDYVAIDNYLPLADINPELADPSDAGEDRRALQYDQSYLRGNVEGGERWSYFYASDADRAARIRTPIADGAYGKPWVFRAKAIREWLGNLHYNRPGGVESLTPTAWTPNAKPVIFTEFGAAAVDLAANQPNVFVDVKSTESALPHFSSGARDDSAKRAFTRAFWAEWSAIGGAQVDLDWCCDWNWDFRAYPAFPGLVGKWSDAENWAQGFWWTGRAASLPLSGLLTATAAEYGLSIDASAVVGEINGYTIDSPMTWRAAVEPVLAAFAIDVIDDGTGNLRAVSRSLLRPIAVAVDDLAMLSEDGPRYQIAREREARLPRQVRVTYASGEDGDYRTAQAVHTLGGGGEGVLDVTIPAAMQHQAARDAAQRIVRDLGLGREKLSGCAIAPAHLGVTVGDVLTIAGGDWQVTRLAGGVTRALEARRVDLEALQPGNGSGVGSAVVAPPALAAPALYFLDLPQVSDAADDWQGYIAAHAAPWPAGGLDIYRSPTEDDFALSLNVPFQAIVGETTTTIAYGTLSMWSDATLGVEVYSGALSSATEAQVLAGANAVAVETGAGAWEIIQFVNATLTAPRRYTLAKLLRGRRGTDAQIVSSLAAGARIVVLDARVLAVPMARADAGLNFNWRFGPSGRALSDASFQTVAHRFAGRGLVPMSPAQLRLSETGGGDISILWRRRSRQRFDPLRLTSAPLDEDFERYRVVINGPSGALRSETVTTPQFAYTAALQSADGNAAISATVRQIGTGGRLGSPRDVLFPE